MKRSTADKSTSPKSAKILSDPNHHQPKPEIHRVKKESKNPNLASKRKRREDDIETPKRNQNKSNLKVNKSELREIDGGG
jgi:uncharacterized membrane-anchored protein